MSGSALSADAARGLILAAVDVLPAEPVALADCLGRVSAAAVLAPGALPAFDNSAMDGYAVRSGDLAAGPARLRIAGESRAGRPAPAGLGPGEALRISTGAMLPHGADAVVPLEQAREEDGWITATATPVERGAWVRRAGEDVEAGREVLPAGRRLGPAEVGMLAALGIDTVDCVRRPRVAILTGGDELLDPGTPMVAGGIYDSNRFSLLGLAREAGTDAEFAGRMPDDPDRTRETIAAALDADLVVLSGGVSVGRHDHVKRALAELGVEQLFWRIAMRPGGPTWGGVVRRPGRRPTLVLGLAGNPVSSQVGFRLFAEPVLLAATGRDPEPRRATAALAADFSKPAGKAQYLRCRLEAGNGGWLVRLTTPRQGSHVQSSMLGAECLAVIPAERERVAAGEPVEVLLP